MVGEQLEHLNNELEAAKPFKCNLASSIVGNVRMTSLTTYIYMYM